MGKFSEKFNTQRKFNVDTSGFSYCKLSDLYKENGGDKIYPVKAVYINTKSKFGDSPVIATDSFFVNLPTHLTETARDILADNEAIDEINSGNVGFTVYEYAQQKYNRMCYSIRFVDLPNE